MGLSGGLEAGTGVEAVSFSCAGLDLPQPLSKAKTQMMAPSTTDCRWNREIKPIFIK
jgi:hypothetical protein